MNERIRKAPATNRRLSQLFASSEINIGEACQEIGILVSSHLTERPNIGLYQLARLVAPSIPYFVPPRIQAELIEAMKDPDQAKQTSAKDSFMWTNIKTLLSVVEKKTGPNTPDETKDEMLVIAASVLVSERYTAYRSDEVSEQIHMYASRVTESFLSEERTPSPIPLSPKEIDRVALDDIVFKTLLVEQVTEALYKGNIISLADVEFLETAHEPSKHPTHPEYPYSLRHQALFNRLAKSQAFQDLKEYLLPVDDVVKQLPDIEDRFRFNSDNAQLVFDCNRMGLVTLGDFFKHKPQDLNIRWSNEVSPARKSFKQAVDRVLVLTQWLSLASQQPGSDFNLNLLFHISDAMIEGDLLKDLLDSVKESERLTLSKMRPDLFKSQKYKKAVKTKPADQAVEADIEMRKWLVVQGYKDLRRFSGTL